MIIGLRRAYECVIKVYRFPVCEVRMNIHKACHYFIMYRPIFISELLKKEVDINIIT